MRTLVTMTLVVLGAGTALAQFSADVKISGRAFRHGEAATYQRHARDYSQMLYYGSRCEQPMATEQAKQQVAGVRQNIKAAGKALDQLKTESKAKPEVAKRIDKIKEHHAKVIAKCDELDQHIAKADKDTTVICDCCVDILEELDAATAETEKLKGDLDIKDLPKPEKAKKAAPGKK